VAAVKAISLDPQAEVELADGRRWTALQIQQEYLAQALRYLDRSGGNDPVTGQVATVWGETLEDLAQLPEVAPRAGRRLDWLIKKSFLQTAMAERGWRWEDPRLSEMEDSYHSLGSDNLYSLLRENGLVEARLIDAGLQEPGAVGAALTHPPSGTRAATRGRLIATRGQEIAWANWTTIAYGETDLQELMDPTLEEQ
jgi:proteasome accessory factor A